MEEIFRFTYVAPPRAVDDDRVLRLPIADTRISAVLLRDDRDSAAIRSTASDIVGSFDTIRGRFEFVQLMDIRDRLLAAAGDSINVCAIAEEVVQLSLSQWLIAPDVQSLRSELTDLIAAIKFIESPNPLDFQAYYHGLVTLDFLQRSSPNNCIATNTTVQRMLNRQVSLPYRLETNNRSVADSTLPSSSTPASNTPAHLQQLQLRRQNIDNALEDLRNLAPEDTIELQAQLDEHGHRILVPPGNNRFAAATDGNAARFVHRDAIERLPASTRQVFSDNQLEVDTLPLTTLISRLEEQQRWALRDIESASIPNLPAVNMVAIGSTTLPANNPFLPGMDLNLVAEDAPSVPGSAGLFRPSGIGHLMVTMQHLTRYQGGDLAHVENVLLNELKTRRTRRLERVEDIFTQEEESSREELWDTQTTQRYEIKEEAEQVLQEDENFNIGGKVSGGYAPFVQAEITTGYETSSSQQNTSRNAATYAREIMEKASVKVTQRTKELRTITTIYEFEENNEHTFNNVGGEDHISGQFQWLNKIYEAQVYDLGVRMLWDLMVPEPAAFYKQVMEHTAKPKHNLTPPKPFNKRFSEINIDNYQGLARDYKVNGVTPPPPETKVVYESFQQSVQTGEVWMSLSKNIQIPENYQPAEYRLILYVAPIGAQDDDEGHPVDRLSVQVGSHTETYPPVQFNPDGIAFHAQTENTYVVFGSINSGDDFIGNLPVNIMLSGGAHMQATIEVECQNHIAYDKWQLNTWEKLLQGYQAQQQLYENKLAELSSQDGITFEGNNPLENKRIQEDELKRAAISMITGQYFELFSSILESGTMEARVDFEEALAEGKYAQFFEDAFEWDKMVYEYLPYYWSRRSTWVEKMLTQDNDPLFNSFLKASFAKVRLAVRPDYEQALLHLLENGTIWEGGDLPPVNNADYIALMEELRERRSEELHNQRIPVGEPFEIPVPTTLVRLRPGNTLPSWSRNELGEWQEDPVDA